MAYKLKAKNEDFQVFEVPLMPIMHPKKKSTYTYVWLKKSGFTTFEALDSLKEFFKLKFSDLANQGLKDEDAITEQLISIKKIIGEKERRDFNKKYSSKNKYFRIERMVGYGKTPVTEKILHGNSFRVTVRNLRTVEANKLTEHLKTEPFQSLLNYYDNQRFGMPGGPYNTHHIGSAIVHGDWQGALKHFKKTNNFFQLSKEYQKIEDPEALFKTINPKKISFFVSAYNSFLWNRALSKEVVKKNSTKKYSFKNVGKLHLTVGAASESAKQIPSVFRIKGYEFLTDKFLVRSKIISRIFAIKTVVYSDAVENDELHPGKKKVILSFFLPPGSYATMLIRQIFLRLK